MDLLFYWELFFLFNHVFPSWRMSDESWFRVALAMRISADRSERGKVAVMCLGFS